MTGGTAEARDSWARSGAVWFHLHCGCRSLHCRPLSRHFPLLRPELPLPHDRSAHSMLLRASFSLLTFSLLPGTFS